MDTIFHFLHYIASIEGITEMIRWGGLVLLFVIVFVETGLLVGFFLPGDSLLFTAGFLAATTELLKIEQLIPALCVAAIAGDSVGYAIGRRAGAGLYQRPDSRWFKRAHLLSTRAFYENHGAFTIVLARFIPFVRTFAPTVAGIAHMNYRTFLAFNVLGGIGWVVLMSFLGYSLGQVPGAAENVEKAILAIILLSLTPVIWRWLRAPSSR